MIIKKVTYYKFYKLIFQLKINKNFMKKFFKIKNNLKLNLILEEQKIIAYHKIFNMFNFQMII